MKRKTEKLFQNIAVLYAIAAPLVYTAAIVIKTLKRQRPTYHGYPQDSRPDLDDKKLSHSSKV